jgi:putative thiamine transport system permease protein
MIRAAPPVAIFILLGPIIFGLAATFLPAFGYLPALGGETATFAAWDMLFSQPGLLRSCLISLASGLITTAAALAVTFAFVAGWSQSRFFAAMQHLVSPLLSVPHAAAAFGLAFLFTPSGWLMRLVSPQLTGMVRPPDWLIVHDPLGLSMMAGLFAKELPFLFLITLAALPQSRPRRNVLVARNLGYGRIAAFAHGPWPSVYTQVRLAVFAVIAYSSSVVDVALILGPTNPPPLAVRLVTWMNDTDLSTRFMASAGAVLQLIVTALALALWLAGETAVRSVNRRMRRTGRRFAGDAIWRFAAAGLASASAAAVFLGLLVLALWSLTARWPFPDALPKRFTLDNWVHLSSAFGRPLAITVAIGLAATAIALVFAIACLERERRTGIVPSRGAMAIIYAPLIVPQVSFIFGLQLFFLVMGMDASLAGLIIVHLTFVFPYVLLSLTDPWRSWDPRYGQAARSLGATENRVFWRVRLPMLTRAVLVAGAVGFAVSVGQYLPTLLIGAGRWPTVTTEAVALAAGGDRRVIGVYAFIQMFLPFLGFALAALVPAVVFSRRRDMRAAA